MNKYANSSYFLNENRELKKKLEIAVDALKAVKLREEAKNKNHAMNLRHTTLVIVDTALEELEED